MVQPPRAGAEQGHDLERVLLQHPFQRFLGVWALRIGVANDRDVYEMRQGLGRRRVEIADDRMRRFAEVVRGVRTSVGADEQRGTGQGPCEQLTAGRESVREDHGVRHGASVTLAVESKQTAREGDLLTTWGRRLNLWVT